ncbi:hypothetical protein CTM45_06520 [Prevotella intermedia]|uniref:Uncharacterized protein n=1 Tax=Prevotella intermedia TaxID=28131 RepID=A0A2D3LJM1_PREIN|nr:hypothetical protein CTM46_04565 [Prevotella intermedia]PJI22971.1 hypothetical protein CTM45_06520 [Prevotella intermedia]
MFCVPKVAVLHGKSVGFAVQKRRFRNAKTQLSLFNKIFFTKWRRFSAKLNAYGMAFKSISSYLRSLKNCCISLLHSSSRTPFVTIVLL